MFEVEENEVECYSAIFCRLSLVLHGLMLLSLVLILNFKAVHTLRIVLVGKGGISTFLLNVSNFYHFDMADFLVTMNHHGNYELHNAIHFVAKYHR